MHKFTFVRIVGNAELKQESKTLDNQKTENSASAHNSSAANCYVDGLEINKKYAEMYPNNCAIFERTADGKRAGVCTFHLRDGVCPRHGKVKK